MGGVVKPMEQVLGANGDQFLSELWSGPDRAAILWIVRL